MNTITKQIVYLPAKEDYGIYLGYSDGYSNKGNLQPEQGYFFTPKQLNEYTQSVIKQALETAAENAEPDYWKGDCQLCGSNQVDKQSITNTFEETFKLFEL